jgi:hypothetical protein
VIYPHRIGIGMILVGIALLSAGGYQVARSPEFLAGYRIRSIDAVFHGTRLEASDTAYFQKEMRRLRRGCMVALCGFAALMGGVVLARYAQRRLPSVRRARPLPSLFEGVVNR